MRRVLLFAGLLLLSSCGFYKDPAEPAMAVTVEACPVWSTRIYGTLEGDTVIVLCLRRF